MHELGLAEGILETVLTVAADREVASVNISAGVLQAVMPESLQFSFDLLASGSCAGGARLQVSIAPALIECRDCGSESHVLEQPFLCLGCRSSSVRLISGGEIRVEQIEFVDGSILRSDGSTARQVRP